MKKKGDNKKSWFTKKRVLIITNTAMFVILAAVFMFRWAVLGVMPVGPFTGALNYLLTQVAFTICSLIVYYLSIIADAVSKRNEILEKYAGQEGKE